MEKNFKLYMAQSSRPVHLDKNYEHVVLDKWKRTDLYHAVNESLTTQEKSPFTLVDGPPYANGGAHLGHVLNKVWKDLAVKSQWFFGRPAQWTPGWDCHGLPLELQVDKKHPHADETAKKNYCKQLALRSVSKQRNDFKHMGVHADWDSPYLTLSEPMKQASWKTVKKMYEDDLLQYKMWPVHHCPACASSLAEAELEYSDKERLEFYFKYPLQDGTFALVWTTTPWTLPMNQALAFHSAFQYQAWNKEQETLYVDAMAGADVLSLLHELGYQTKGDTTPGTHFLNTSGVSPLLKQTTPVLHGDFVLPGQTGFVHVAGAHGVEDYELVSKHHLTPLNFLDSHGRYEESPSLPEVFWGKKNTTVNDLVSEQLGHLLLKQVTTKVETAHCWRHKTKVYYQATRQVFLDLEKLKPKVAEMLSHSNLSPVVKTNLESMLLNRPHWCLSRQRYWGTELNLLVNKEDKTLSPLSSTYLEFFTMGQEKEAEQFLLSHPEVYAVKDVLDVWFDSGNVAYALGEKFNFKQADLALEGKDQYRGWFQSLLWLHAVHHTEVPYKNLMVHGFVLDDKKMKFSKSSGNGVSAKEALLTYGADPLRLWASLQEEHTDAVFSETKMNEAKSYYQRLRLTLRFLSSNAYTKTLETHQRAMDEFSKESSFDFYAFTLHETNVFLTKYKAHLGAFEYKAAAHALYHFFDKFLSRHVFEVMKQPLYLKGPDTKEKRMAQACCFELLYQMLKAVAVFCPFVAEEFFEQSSLSDELQSVFLLPERPLDYSFSLNWSFALEMRELVTSQLEPLQQQKLAKGSSQLHCVFTLNEVQLDRWHQFNEAMPQQYWLGVSLAEATLGDSLSVLMSNLSLNDAYKKCPRCWNYDLVDHFVGEVCHHCEHDA